METDQEPWGTFIPVHPFHEDYRDDVVISPLTQPGEVDDDEDHSSPNNDFTLHHGNVNEQDDRLNAEDRKQKTSEHEDDNDSPNNDLTLRHGNENEVYDRSNAEDRKQKSSGSQAVDKTKQTMKDQNITLTLTSSVDPVVLWNSKSVVLRRNAVFFVFNTHPGTKAWHKSISKFSKNRVEHRECSDDIVEQVREKLSEKGINEFYVRKGSGKLFDKNGECRGVWEQATEKEVSDKTKERFKDDRRPTKTWKSESAKAEPAGTFGLDEKCENADMETDNTSETYGDVTRVIPEIRTITESSLGAQLYKLSLFSKHSEANSDWESAARDAIKKFPENFINDRRLLPLKHDDQTTKDDDDNVFVLVENVPPKSSYNNRKTSGQKRSSGGPPNGGSNGGPSSKRGPGYDPPSSSGRRNPQPTNGPSNGWPMPNGRAVSLDIGDQSSAAEIWPRNFQLNSPPSRLDIDEDENGVLMTEILEMKSGGKKHLLQRPDKMYDMPPFSIIDQEMTQTLSISSGSVTRQSEEEHKLAGFGKLSTRLLIPLLSAALLVSIAFAVNKSNDSQTKGSGEPAIANVRPSLTLMDYIRARGQLVCGVMQRPGFCMLNSSTRTLSGFEVDLVSFDWQKCRGYLFLILYIAHLRTVVQNSVALLVRLSLEKMGTSPFQR